MGPAPRAAASTDALIYTIRFIGRGAPSTPSLRGKARTLAASSPSARAELRSQFAGLCDEVIAAGTR